MRYSVLCLLLHIQHRDLRNTQYDGGLSASSSRRAAACIVFRHVFNLGKQLWITLARNERPLTGPSGNSWLGTVPFRAILRLMPSMLNHHRRVRCCNMTPKHRLALLPRRSVSPSIQSLGTVPFDSFSHQRGLSPSIRFCIKGDCPL